MSSVHSSSCQWIRSFLQTILNIPHVETLVDVHHYSQSNKISKSRKWFIWRKKENFPRSDRGRRGERSHNGGTSPPAIAVPDHRQQDQQGTGHPQCGRQETRGEDDDDGGDVDEAWTSHIWKIIRMRNLQVEDDKAGHCCQFELNNSAQVRWNTLDKYPTSRLGRLRSSLTLQILFKNLTSIFLR